MITTEGGSTELRPRTSSLPFTASPSDSTSTPRRPGPESRPAMSRPAVNESSDDPTAAVAVLRVLDSKRAAATTTLPSRRSVPMISPAVEQPTMRALGKARARSSKGRGSAPNSGAPKATTRVRSESRSGRSSDQPPAAEYESVASCTSMDFRVGRPGPAHIGSPDRMLDLWPHG